jgi:hypothetical protein
MSSESIVSAGSVPLYHRVAPEFEGTTLYPLNVLKEVKPHLYDRAVAKYHTPGRKHILDCRVPPLDCAWNDVLHFSLLHPSVIRNAFNRLGRDIEFDSFELNIGMLDPARTVIYHFAHMSRRDMYRPGNFEPYSPEAVPVLSDVPAITQDYYKAKFEVGEEPLLYVGVPHIMYRGTLDVGGLAIVHS